PLGSVSCTLSPARSGPRRRSAPVARVVVARVVPAVWGVLVCGVPTAWGLVVWSGPESREVTTRQCTRVSPGTEPPGRPAPRFSGGGCRPDGAPRPPRAAHRPRRAGGRRAPRFVLLPVRRGRPGPRRRARATA